MTTEQPTRPARPPRPGPAFRRAALGLPPDPSFPSDGPPPRPAPRRESLREALARIPDLDADHQAGSDADRAEASGPHGLAGGDLTAAAAAGAVAGSVVGAGAAARADAAVGADQAGAESDTPRGLRSFASRLLNGPLPEEFELHELPDESADGFVGPDGPAGVVAAGALATGAAAADAVIDESELFTPVVSPGPSAGSNGSATASPPAAAVADLAPDAPDWLVLAAAEEAEARGRRAPRPPMVPRWRRVLFGVTVTALIASVPVLGVVGYRLVTESTDGQFRSSVKSPDDPGYEQEVISTPTQLVLHKDATGRPVAATVLSLSGTDGGGAVIHVPLQAEVRTPGYGVDRIIRAFDVLADEPAYARQQVAVQVANLLNVGIDSVVEIDDRGWAQLVEPVAPLTIVNPDPIEIGGQLVESGSIELTADQVGPYLAAEIPGESAFNRSLRHEAVWTAWMDAVAASDRDDVVPGERSSGIGLFARSLAAGPVTYSTVPVESDPEIEGLLRVDFTSLNDIVLAAVPMPDSPGPGARPTVRLLNGVSADEIPGEIIQTVVQIGGAVTVVGNGPTFGRDDTTIVFADPGLRGYAELLQVALGGGTPRLDPEAEDSVGLTVILGRDVVDGASATTTRPATSTTTGDTDTDTGVTDTDTDTDTDSGVTDTEPDSGGA
jgi:hypothetical protein